MVFPRFVQVYIFRLLFWNKVLDFQNSFDNYKIHKNYHDKWNHDNPLSNLFSEYWLSLATQQQISLFIVSWYTSRLKRDILGYEDLVIGDWEFEITERATLPDLFKSEEVCSHELPNK